MKSLSAKLATYFLFLSCAFLNAQQLGQGDPGNRGAPMYSKSQKKQMAKYRRVQGTVRDERDNPVNGALVNLKNLRSNQTETFVTKTDGHYAFDELSRDDDYELIASFSGKKTLPKKLSHYDTQSNSMRILSFAEPDEKMSVKAEKK